MVRSPQIETEQQIVELLDKDDRSALIRLYDKYAPALFGIIIRITSDAQIAEHCLLITFNEIWNQRSSYNSSKEKLFTWMVKIARAATLKVASVEKNHDAELCEVINLLFRLDVKHFINHINLLDINLDQPGISKDQQAILDLIYLKNFTCAEAAIKLNISLDVLNVNVIKAIKQLRRLY